MTRSALTEGRAGDVARMLEPLVAELSRDGVACPDGRGEVLVCLLLARVRLLRFGDAAGARSLLEAIHRSEGRVTVEDEVERRLWLGWTHLWAARGTTGFVRALHLLEEAAAHESGAETPLAFWSHLGRSLAYHRLDEPELARGALTEATRLEPRLRDLPARAWLLDVRSQVALSEGDLGDAERDVDELDALGRRAGDAVLSGRAAAHRALLRFRRGDAPELVLADGTEADELLGRSVVAPCTLQLQLWSILVRTLARAGAVDEAERRASAASDDALPFGRAHLLLALASVHLQRGQHGRAAEQLEAAARGLDRLPPSIEAELADLRGAYFLALGATDAALAEACSAVATARTLRRRPLLAAALLFEARVRLARGERPHAARLLAEAGELVAGSGELPLIARRTALASELAEADGRDGAARALRHLARGAAVLTGVPDGGGEPAHPEDAALPSPDLLLDLLEHLSASARLAAWAALRWLASPDGTAAAVFQHHAGGGWRMLTGSPSFATLDERPDPSGADDQQLARSRWTLLGHCGDRALYLAVSRSRSDRWPECEALALARLACRSALAREAHFQAERAAGGASAAERGTRRDRGVHPAPHGFAESTVTAGLHVPVLLCGEAGTGKEAFARRLHGESGAGGPFVSVNCANEAADVLETLLFGRDGRGAVEAAREGTLLLNAVEELSGELQLRLVRALGGPATPRSPGTPRLVAGTRADLAAHVRAGRFREDLFLLLSARRITLKPLRERRRELPLLVHHLLCDLRPRGAALAAITDEALEALVRYDWPGNLRQLRNEIERALLVVGHEPVPVIGLADLSPSIQERRTAPPAAEAPVLGPEERILMPGHDLGDVLAGTERALIERVLAEHEGQVTTCAHILGLTRQGLYKKMKRLGIDVARFQPGPAATS